MKKYLIIGIILLIISLGLVIYREFINGPINIYNITNNGLKKDNTKVYLDATFVAGSITGNDDTSYHVMFGDGVQYIVYMNNQKADEIARYLLDNPEKSYHIEGVTKLIPSEIEENGLKFVKEWLDNNHSHVEENHSHNVTIDDFYHYFGYVYLDSTRDFDIIRIVIYLTGIMGILFVMYFVNTKYRFI